MLDVRTIESEIDLRLNLLSGDAMKSKFLKVHPLTIGEIKNIGFLNYSRFLVILTIDKNSLSELAGYEIKGKNSLIDTIIMSKDELLINAFAEALCVFLREDMDSLLINEKYGFVFGGLKLDRDINDCNMVNRDNFDDFVQIIKYQNCLIDTKETYKKPKPANNRSSKILEKINKGKEMIAKAKEKMNKENGSTIDFPDIISAVSTKSNHYNKKNVWDLTMYQLYDEYKRLEAISNYETSIMAMVQGAKIEDLKHWSSRID